MSTVFRLFVEKKFFTAYNKAMKNLKLLRKSANMTLQQLATVLNTSTQVLSRYERGEHQADYATLQKIARFFNVSIDYLLDFKSAVTPTDSLTAQEKLLVGYFRTLPVDLQHRAEIYMQTLSKLTLEEQFNPHH